MRSDPTEELLEQLLEAHDRVAGQEHTPGRQTSRANRQRRRRFVHGQRIFSIPGFIGHGRLIIGGAAGSVLLAVATLIAVLASVNSPSALADQMDRMAAIAISESRPGIPGKGQYLYTESYELTSLPIAARGKQCNLKVLVHRRIWRATDGSGALWESATDGRFTSVADKRVCASIGITSPTSHDRTAGNSYGAGKRGLPFITNDWRAYSTNPKHLLQQVHEHDGGPNTPAELLANVVDYLREADTPPAIRAALYRATALIPGVRLLGQRTDPKGQRGLAVEISPRGRAAYVAIFDRKSARLLAEEYLKSGRISSWSAYTRQAIVDSHPPYPLSAS